LSAGTTTGSAPGRAAESAHTTTGIEIWGGLECTVARLGDTFRDQLADIGHRHRAGDLDTIAQLGLRRLRYPVLWEKVAPAGLDV